MRRQMSLAGDLLASHAFAFAGFRDDVAERRLRLGAIGSEIRRLKFGFGFLVSHLRSVAPGQIAYGRNCDFPLEAAA